MNQEELKDKITKLKEKKISIDNMLKTLYTYCQHVETHEIYTHHETEYDGMILENQQTCLICGRIIKIGE